MGRIEGVAEPSVAEDARSIPPFLRQTLPTSLRLTFTALFVVALVEGAHNLIVVRDRIPNATGWALFYGLHVAGAAVVSLFVGPIVASLLTAWHRVRDHQLRRSLLILSAVLGCGVGVYQSFAPRIERAIHLVFRRLFDDVAYELSPDARDLWQVIGTLLVPAAILCWGAGRLQSLALQRTRRGEFGVPRAVGCILCLAGGSIAWWNTSFWINLYRPLHFLLYGIAVVMVLTGIVVWRVRVISLLPAILFSAISLFVVHFALAGNGSVEALTFGNTTSLREQVRALRWLGDFDGDGSSRWFGGDDPDDSDPSRWFGRMEVPGNDVDDNGLGGDAVPVILGREVSLTSTGLDRAMKQVVLISVDALRWDALHYLNSDAPVTPSIDGLSEHSLRFRRAYAQASYTRYSFGSMWHSCIPDALDIDGLVGPSVLTLLRENGIQTIAVVPALFERLDFKKLGFNEFHVPVDDALISQTSEQITDRALEVLSRGAPGFYWVHYFDPHSPYVGSSGSDKARYLEEVQATDAAIGRLLAGLTELGNDDRAICFMSDHGDEFGDHGGAHHGMTLYEEAVHVPLLVSAPGIDPDDIEMPVRLIDLAPTILDLFHLPRTRELRGRSLLGGDVGVDRSLNPPVVSMSETGLRMFIEPTGRWKLIWKLCDDYVEVFDLMQDPQELNNLVDQAPDRVNWLIEQLEQWMARESSLRAR